MEWSNLQRQFLFDESDAAEALPKAIAAAQALGTRQLRSDRRSRWSPISRRATWRNFCEDVDLILDGTDNFETRYLINDFAVRERFPGSTEPPWAATGSSWRSCPGGRRASAASIPSLPKGSSQLAKPKACWGPSTAAIAALQAGDALKILARGTGGGGGAADHDRCVDRRDPPDVAPPRAIPNACAASRRDFVYLNGKHRAPISLCGRNAVQIHERLRPVDPGELARA